MAILRGTAKKDRLTGTSLADIISGLGGNDVLKGGAGNDTLNGGAGNDEMRGGSGNDKLFGGSGRDKLFGNAGNDQLTGGTGNDELDGGIGNDRMDGGKGDDAYKVDSIGDRLTDASGNDSVLATISFTLPSGIENLVLGGAQPLNGAGNAGNNILVGNGAVNTLTGGDGNDALDGKGGNDFLFGGAGNDIFIVDSAGDVVSDTSGNDSVASTAANFTLPTGIELLLLIGAANINGTGNAGSNTLFGNSGNNILRPGDDTLADVINGGDGSDTVSYEDATGFGAGVNMAVQSSNLGKAFGDTYASIENVTGSNFSDDIFADDNDNVLTGLIGADVLRGEGGNDTLFGGDGSDELFGGTGTNTIDLGNDTQTDRVHLNPNGVASILNFDFVDNDRLVIDQSLFSGFQAAIVDNGNYFQIAGAPSNIYPGAEIAPLVYLDTLTGNLFFDVNGDGGALPVLIASSASFIGGLSSSAIEIIP